jgi:hypothetical protein
MRNRTEVVFGIKTLLLLIILFSFRSLRAQDSAVISSKYLDAIASESKTIEQKLDKKSKKLLASLQKQEARMQKKLMKLDSTAAKNVFSDSKQKYEQLESKLSNAGNYIPKLDSLATSLKFLENNPQFLNQAKEVKDKLKDAMAKMEGLKQQLAKAENIKQFIRERKQFLKDQLSKFGFTKELKKLNKEVYYYAQQVKEYKEILKDSRKAEKKALELLSKTKIFREFMRKNSQLASLFRLPNPDEPASMASLAGLQTRAQVNGLIQQQLAAGGPNARQQFSQNLQAAQAQLQQLKNKVLQGGGGSSDDIMPEGFKPNNEKTKSFWQRLEYGTNLQSQKANGYFPVTSDIGLSVGYKLNPKSIIGIGASYKMGWGSGIRNIRITQQGVGLRSFVDWKIKGSLWISGGFEMNYKTLFNSISQLQDLNAWQQSGLVGISKTVSIKSKFFKKTKLQLLWDFLSYQQIPRTQPVLFRIGYNF